LAEVDQYHITDWRLLWRCCYVTGAVIIGFLLQPVTGLNPCWVALIGATILTVICETKEVHDVMKVVRTK
jgi:Na+/H+ antiporter NhaD/arsenite permease-like protein